MDWIACKKTLVHVVEQDTKTRDSIYALLGKLRAEIKIFDNAEAFLAEPLSDIPDCLIADAELPGMDGLQLLEQLRRRGLQIPVIILAEEGEVQLAVRAMQAGASDFIEKPFGERVFLDRVRRVINEAM